MALSLLEHVAVGAAAVAGGAVNALAGGGTLITFPTLTAVGIPAVRANVTNTVALTPGYLGGTLAQRRDLDGQGHRLWLLLPAGILGGLTGGVLLVITSEGLFRQLVPYLILLASLLLAVQERVRAVLVRRATERSGGDPHEAWVLVPAFVASVYGGYFGAGLGVIVLAVLGLVIDDTLTRINALKQALSFAVNVTAALFFLFSGKVVWSAALVMAAGAVAGGVIGGRLAGRIPAGSLRRAVVAIGVAVAVVYFVR
ncbi:MAG TPA: sulfite exporter TauE/SafE family protein [Actinomycetota bacterium]